MEKVKIERTTEHDFWTIVAKIKSFSNTNIHTANETSPEYIDYEISNDKFKYKYPLGIYTNAEYDNKNAGYVSLILRGKNLYAKNVELTCIVAVIDSEGSKRFLQSFAFCYDLYNKDYNPKFVIDKYIARNTLCNNKSELLPSDTLTLHMEVYLVLLIEIQNVFDLNTVFVKPCFRTEKHSNGNKYSLFLDSLVAERLREESRYFKRILVTPMEEKRTRYMHIPDEEYQTFTEIGCILLGATSITVDSIDSVFRLYAFADKYDIPVVTESCRNMLKSCLSVVDVSEVLEVANMYNDDILRKIVTNFPVNNVPKSEEAKEESDSAKEESFEWTCGRIAGKSKFYLNFTQQLLVNADKNDAQSLDFYS